jgi:hypothetical protein
MTASVILYGTPGCHLCEQAAAVIELAGATVSHIDITDDDILLERYGVRIPLLRREDLGIELGWPFDSDQVSKFLS